MNRPQLILRTLRYYWRTNLAVLLGVAVGAAVICGALIVGDSVRFSLEQMTLDRLGNVDYALSGSRFFREEIASDIAEDLSKQPGGGAIKVAPAILLTASLQFERTSESAEESYENRNDEPTILTAGQVNLMGLDERLWKMLKGDVAKLPDENSLVLNRRVADQLKIQEGDELFVYVDVPQTIPQESLLGERDVDEIVISFSMTVTTIVEPASTLGRFSLQPNQQLPLNAYLNLSRLQQELDLLEAPVTPRNPIAKPARVNALLISGGKQTRTPQNAVNWDVLANRALKQSLELEDFHARIRTLPEQGYFALESERMILEQALSNQAIKTAQGMEVASSPVLVYLANEIANASNPDLFSMYSIAAGIPFDQSAPFGPQLNTNGDPVTSMSGNNVAINSWLAKDLQVEAGDEILLKYHVVGSRGKLPELEERFKVAAILPIPDTLADDRGFTPFVPGITDAKTFNDWEQPFPMNTDRITDRDDEYWEGSEGKPDGYKSTPKVFLPLKTARDLWQSRYGDTTSVRIASKPELGLEETVSRFRQRFVQTLVPQQFGMVILPVKQQGLQAAQGTQDFTGLFIGFSFFVIAAAAVLISLLFRLGIETRVQQTGLYSAVGMSKGAVHRLLLSEGVLVAIVGIVIGMMLGVLYAELMIYGLTTWWRGAIGTSFLQVYVQPASLAIGGSIAFFVALPGMWLGLRQLLKLSAKDRLHGVLSSESSAAVNRSSGGYKLWSGIVCLVIAIGLVLGILLGVTPKTEAFGGFNWHIVSFFAGGFLSLIGSLLLYVVLLRNSTQRSLRGRGVSSAILLGLRNPSRQRQRSSITVVLVAFATFVVVAVAAGRQKPSQMEPDFNSGNGGFSIVAESARPVLYDLSTEEGQTRLGLIQADDTELRALLDQSKIMPFRVRPGEDASCLNLYQTRLPKILGVTEEMIERGGFLFADTPGENPWELLRGTTKDGNIPVLGDMNTLQYSLHKAIGSTIELPPELEASQSLEVVGSLGGSVFQGVLLMSEENFLKLFPNIEGYNYFLMEAPQDQMEDLTQTLETRLVSIGFDAEPVGRRLENFLAVQNTYLSTFQALGGLGLLLGTIGLGTVMLRNVLERRSELALMRAVGFSKAMVAMMVLAENSVLLITGLLIGTLTALWAMLPNILARSADVPWLSGVGLLAAVLMTGLISALFAIVEAIRTPILSTLRGE
ncbi:MAG TPA: hypothetical protein DD473_11725 [Planctomycetaceae bacterium]|nr:hypothetical protein [Planctomycetaceae bacterium]